MEASYGPSVSLNKRKEVESVSDKVRTFPMVPEKNNQATSHANAGNIPYLSVYANL
jgi:hypothetical protein